MYVTIERHAHATIRSFIRRFRTEILAEWMLAARDIPVAKPLPEVTLVDHLPELIDGLAELAEMLVAGKPVDGEIETARRHAIDRLAEGFGISAVVAELSLLRGCIMNVWARENPGGDSLELRSLHLAIDRAIASSVARYAEARERTLAGIDRISTASFESRDLDELLGRLLDVFMQTTPAVDTAAILLLEGDRLQLRAAVGFDAELAAKTSIALGEGFAGTIAATRKPLALRAAYLDPIVQSMELKERGVHALYGLPMLQGDQVLGVAHMGSRTAHEFSEEDRQYFASMVSRATLAIHHHVLREELTASERQYKQIAAERERALAKLESLLAASPIAIGFLDRDLRYLRVNDALAALNGRPAAEHIGRTVAEILPQVADRLEPLLRRILDGGESIMNLPFKTDDGKFLLANYFPIRSSSGEITSAGAIVIDVTEEKAAQDQLAREQAQLQSILDHAPWAVWLKDAEGRIVLANKRVSDAIGAPYETLIGKRSSDVLPAEVAIGHEDHDQLVRRTGEALEVEEEVPSEGGTKTFLAIKFPIPTEPPLVGAIATEITERKQMESELRSAVKSREDLLAVVSHDLRSPLATIQLGISMLKSQHLTDHRMRRHLEVVDRASQRMESLIDDLLDSANIRTGRLILETHREPIDAVVNEAVDLQQPVAAEKGLSLRRSNAPEGEIICDRGRILQVFGNLIGNAIKFCRAGDTITVNVSRNATHVTFSVTDTGPGIQPEVLPHLFEPYWSAAEHAASGSGLGLYICRGIVEGHGGRLWVQSTPGQGATFYFTLPIAP
jgi:PAS domain S-box-containing protein